MSAEQLSYITSVRAAFPVIGDEEERYLTGFISWVRDYIDTDSDCTSECLTEHFGTPEQIAFDYYNIVGTDISSQLEKSSRNIKLIIAAAVTTIIILIGCIIGYNLYSGFPSDLQSSSLSIHELPAVTVYKP